MLRILVADDHPIVRLGLKGLLTDEFPLSVVEEARDASEVLRLVRKEEWDLVVLDVNLPGRSGLEVLGDLKRERPTMPVLMLSMYHETPLVVRALRAGASGYITKDAVATELAKAVRRIVQGGKYLTESLAEELAFTVLERAELLPHTTLSDREYAVMGMIAAGKTVSEIAEELALSVKTVSTHRGHILEKMGMRTNAELMHYAITRRLVEGFTGGRDWASE